MQRESARLASVSLSWVNAPRARFRFLPDYDESRVFAGLQADRRYQVQASLAEKATNQTASFLVAVAFQFPAVGHRS